MDYFAVPRSLQLFGPLKPGFLFVLLEMTVHVSIHAFIALIILWPCGKMALYFRWFGPRKWSFHQFSKSLVIPIWRTRLERNVAIMAASIPAARPLLQPFLHLTSRRLLKSWSKPISQQSDQRSGPKIHSAPQGKHYENIELPNVGRSSRFGPPSWAVLRSQEDISPARQDVWNVWILGVFYYMPSNLHVPMFIFILESDMVYLALYPSAH